MIHRFIIVCVLVLMASCSVEHSVESKKPPLIGAPLNKPSSLVQMDSLIKGKVQEGGKLVITLSISALADTSEGQLLIEHTDGVRLISPYIETVGHIKVNQEYVYDIELMLSNIGQREQVIVNFEAMIAGQKQRSVMPVVLYVTDFKSVTSKQTVDENSAQTELPALTIIKPREAN